jgi:ATP-dependent DNA helicase RecQ
MGNKINDNLKSRFGFDTYLPGQDKVVSLILNGHSVAAIFSTGGGKSLCYQLPALELPHLTLVVSPLLALMKDQIDFLVSKNIPAARLDSTLDREAYNDILKRAKDGSLKIMMISVERFKNERFRVQLKNIMISLMVVDEAHCISEWGHNFRPGYLKLPDYRVEFKIPNVLLLTATATTEVTDDMCKKFSIPRENVVITGFFRENLYLKITSTKEREKSNELLNRIRGNPNEPTIVYVTLRETAEQVSEMLNANNIPAQSYHAGMKSEEREQIQNRFMQNEINVIVATIAFGMGIDKKNIRRIIHYNLPRSIENYSQEIGRSGRDGKISICEVLANRDNINVLENFVYGDTPERDGIKKLLKLVLDNTANMLNIKISSVSANTNIRVLPLETLLVYLDMRNIIKPRYVFFQDYKFKFIKDANEIIQQLTDDRKYFAQALFTCCKTYKVWTKVSMDKLIKDHGYTREKIIAGLDQFNQEGLIDLMSERAVEVYEIINKDFDIEKLSDELYQLFQDKETHEINRLHKMIEFFESKSCVSRSLAIYFGEHIEKNCGNCSFCKSGPIEIRTTVSLPSLSAYSFIELTNEFLKVSGEDLSDISIVKFLCGINAPIFSRIKAKNMSGFGKLNNYPFRDTLKWVQQHKYC